MQLFTLFFAWVHIAKEPGAHSNCYEDLTSPATSLPVKTSPHLASQQVAPDSITSMWFSHQTTSVMASSVQITSSE